jgi:hypothetical protein
LLARERGGADLVQGDLFAPRSIAAQFAAGATGERSPASAALIPLRRRRDLGRNPAGCFVRCRRRAAAGRSRGGCAGGGQIKRRGAGRSAAGLVAATLDRDAVRLAQAGLTMAFTQSDVDALKQAIATGALECTFGAGPDQRKVTYRNLTDMQRTLAMLQDEVAGAASRPRASFISHSRC